MRPARLTRHPAAIFDTSSTRRHCAQKIYPSIDRFAASEPDLAYDAIVFALLALARNNALVGVEPRQRRLRIGEQNRLAMHEVVQAAASNCARIAAEVVEVRVRDGGGAEAIALASEPQSLRLAERGAGPAHQRAVDEQVAGGLVWHRGSTYHGLHAPSPLPSWRSHAPHGRE